MVTRQNILRKKKKKNVKLHLATSKICQARNLSSNPRMQSTSDLTLNGKKETNTKKQNYEPPQYLIAGILNDLL